MIRRRSPRLVFLLPLFVLLTTAGSAQEYLDTAGRWKTLAQPVLSGWRNDLETPTELFFRDRLHGYLRVSNARDERVQYTTTDGGNTWSFGIDSVAIPHQLVDGPFGFSPRGRVTYDSGAHWTWLASPAGPITSALAFDRNRLAITYYEYVIDDLGPHNIMRLAVSSDGGRNWQPIDSIPEVASFGIDRQTMCGLLPLPPGLQNATYRWDGLGIFLSRDRFAAKLMVDGYSGQTPISFPYFITVDLARRTLEAQMLPRDRFDAVMVKPGLLLDFGLIASGGIAVPTTMMISQDGGATWDSVATPSWLDYARLRLFSPTHAVTTNARTTDGGHTWEPITHHFYFYPSGSTSEQRSHAEWTILAQAVDSSTIVVALPRSLFARTTDLGLTWEQNFSGAQPRCLVACRGRVVVGRDWRSILFSPDSGETWQDLGTLGRVPSDMTTVWALAYPDSVREPMRVQGIAGFHRRNRTYEVRLIESSDGGSSWTEGVRLPVLENGLGLIEPLSLTTTSELDYRYDYAANWNAITFQYVPNRAGTNTGFVSVQHGLVSSTDAGRTWSTLCDSITFARMVMADELRGTAASVMTIRKPTALYMTSDGGASWTWTRTVYSPGHYMTDIGYLGGNSFQALAPNMNRNDYVYSFRTDDGGLTWRMDQLTRAGGFNFTGRLLWLDTSDVHIMRAGSVIYHSTNGGESFHTLHPSVNSQPIWTGFDGSYIYFASPGNIFGRWRIARRWRAVTGIEAADRVGTITLAPNPARDRAEVALHVDRTTAARIFVADALGRVVYSRNLRTLGPGDQRIPIPIDALVPGRYVVHISADGINWSHLFAIEE